MSDNSTFDQMREPGPTQGPVTLAGGWQTIEELGITLKNGAFWPVAVLISCEDNACRFAVGGGNPVAGGGHELNPGSYVHLTHPVWVKTLKLANSTAQGDAVVQITLEY